MRIHIIATGGAVMHNIALELQALGHQVSGSDDEIFDPAFTNLKNAGLLPEMFGWFPEKITSEIDLIILGMHARVDNPELMKATDLGLTIQSFPEFVYNHSTDKKRVVIAGSHGKTTTTAMISHVLKTLDIKFDYLLGSKIDGFDRMVKFSDAPLIIIEGDEYLTSPTDRKPKFLWYKPHLAMITGIAWDHINVFPTFVGYKKQFELFIKSIEPGGILTYFQRDEHLVDIIKSIKEVKSIPYTTPKFVLENGVTIIKTSSGDFPLLIFGEHNLQNMEGAKIVCKELGIKESEFYSAMSTFGGTKNRLEKQFDNGSTVVFRDFAHSPSKLNATIKAVREQFSNKKLVAFFELHTFSSLSNSFLEEYSNSMDLADEAYVFYENHVFELKKMAKLKKEDVLNGFKNVKVLDNKESLIEALKETNYSNTVLLMMSSGNFAGVNPVDFIQ